MVYVLFIENIMGEPEIQSPFTSHSFASECIDRWYKYRVLKMTDSVFIYIGDRDNETFDELALAIPMDNVTGTTIIGNDAVTDSKEIAIHMARKLKKQVFVSSNIRTDNMLKPLIIKRLAQEVIDVPEAF